MKAKQRIREGVRLSEQRDSGKRKLEKMSATEQQILEDYKQAKRTKNMQKHLERDSHNFEAK